MIRVLKKKGRLYFSVPIGKDKMIFNAHRVFSFATIIDCFKKLKLIEVSGIDRNNHLKLDININKVKDENFKCGLFIFEK